MDELRKQPPIMRLHKIRDGRYGNLDQFSLFSVAQAFQGGNWLIMGFSAATNEVLFEGFDTKEEANQFLEDFMVELGYERSGS